MTSQVAASDEAAHRVPKKDVRSIGRELGGNKGAQGVLVVDEHLVAVARGHAAALVRGRRRAMAYVVVAADGVSATAKVPGELVVATHVLAHSVDNLDYCARSFAKRSKRPPNTCVNR